MCGRFSFHLTDLSRIGADLGPTRSGIEHWEPRYNLAPSERAPVVIADSSDASETRRLVPMVWGFATSSGGLAPINARSETVATKSLFRQALQKKRCVVPATGYFEWSRDKPATGQAKQPYWVHPEKNDALLYMAGIWTVARDRAGQPIPSFAILTRDADGAPREVHHRMPVLLSTQDTRTWLPRGPLPAGFLDELRWREHAGEGLAIRPVNPAMNRAGFEGPSCLASPPSEPQISMF